MEQPQSRKQDLRRRVLFVMKIGVSIGLLAILVSAIDLAETLSLLRRLDGETIALLALIMAVQVLLLALRWLIVQGYQGLASGYPATLRITLIGLLFNQTLPTAFGGDAVRVILFRRYCSSYAKAISSVMLDRITALGAVLPMVLVGLPVLGARLESFAVPVWLQVFIAASVFGLILVVLTGRRVGNWMAGLGMPAAIVGLLLEFRGLLVSPVWMLRTMMVALVVHILTCLAVFAMAAQMDIAVGLLESLVLIPVVILISSLPLSLPAGACAKGRWCSP